jgi:hypothetical protein
MAGKITRPDDWDPDSLFYNAPLHRVPDRPTSIQGATDVKPRRVTQAMLLLIEYRNHDLTDEEAGARSGLIRRSRCYWKRCSELRSAGYIVNTGKTRIGSAGSSQMVCAITPEGLAALD